MQRVTITLDDELLEQIDRLAQTRGYQNRSEAIRDLTRAGLQQTATETQADGECIAALVYVYDHAARHLAQRLTHNFHHHHDLSLATLHVHLDDDYCMEVTALRGKSSEVQHLAEHVIAERGVRYGRIVTIPEQAGLAKRKEPRSEKKRAARSHRH
jgi:CopG family transcriptional regulator, nickel-responsive regulator